MTETTTPEITCTACLDSGWDDLFDSPCGACGAALATPEAIAEAKDAHVEAKAAVAESVRAEIEIVDFLTAEGARGNDFAASLARQFKSKGSLTIKQWDAAKRMKARAEEDAKAAATGEVVFRWTKLVDDSWGLRGPAGKVESGATVTVRKASGEESEVVLGEFVETMRGLDVFRPAPRAKAASVVDGPGFYTTADGAIVKVQPARSSGNLYGKVLDQSGIGTAEKLSWNYAPGVVKRITRKLTLEEAQEFGKACGYCGACGALLTNEESIELGIGPICRTKF